MGQAWQSRPSLQPQIHWLDRTLIVMMDVQEALILISNLDGALFLFYLFSFTGSVMSHRCYCPYCVRGFGDK